MTIDTKPNLNRDKFEQFAGEALDLSGCTHIYGGMVIESGGTLSVKGNAGSGKILVSDSQGNLSLENFQGGDSVIYQGEWNADTNNPTLPDASGATGHYYVVNSGGTYNNIDFRIRDWVISDGTKWDIVRNHTAPFFLTQTQYNALTEQEKSDTSKFYLIEDQFSASGITSVLNVGVGDGEVYKDIDTDTLRLRTILGSGDTTVSTSGDTIIVYSEGSGSVASGESIKKEISQSSHGFSVQDVVGFSGGTYNKPIADGTYDGEVMGIVSSVPNINTFELTQAGYISGLTSLVQSTTYFLSDTTAGLLTATQPTGDTHISKAMLLADSTTSGWVLPYAGYVITTGDTASIVVDEQLDSGSTNPVQNQAIATVINQILGVIAEPPVYTAPTANLTAGITQTVEIGTTLTNFTANISFTQNDAGSANGYILCRNNVSISTNQNNTLSESNITSTLCFIGKVSYDCGITKDNNLGIPDPTGKIVAGTVSSPQRTITPQLRQFWGNTSAVPATSADVRGLSNNNFATVNTFNLTTGTVNKIFAVAIPSTKSITSVIDTGNLNLNITSEYELINGSFTVKDAGDNDRTYKLYAMEADTPYPSSTTHAITVS